MKQETGCFYLSDLRHRPEQYWGQLADTVRGIPAKEASLQEWNAALAYITWRIAPEPTAEGARAKLLAFLDGGS